MKIKTIVTSTAEIWIDEDDIIMIEIFQDIYLYEKDVREYLEAMRQISSNETDNLILVDASKFGGLSIEGKRFAKSGSVGDFTKAVAALVGNPISRIVGNFFGQIQTPSYYFLLFTRAESAKRWLLSFQNGGQSDIQQKSSSKFI